MERSLVVLVHQAPTMQQHIDFDVQLLSTPPRALLNSFVERSHRTDDEEFYAINLTSATSRSAFMKMAQAWSLYFNYRRPHFGKNMKGKTPVMALKKFHSMSSVAIGAMPVLNLDRLSLHLAELCDITTIPWNNSPKTQRAVKETMAPYHIPGGTRQGLVGERPRQSFRYESVVARALSHRAQAKPLRPRRAFTQGRVLPQRAGMVTFNQSPKSPLPSVNTCLCSCGTGF